jgi:hypothetical protein
MPKAYKDIDSLEINHPSYLNITKKYHIYDCFLKKNKINESPFQNDFILLENLHFKDLDEFEEFMSLGNLSGKKLVIINFSIDDYYFESQDVYNLICVSTARKFKDRWRKIPGGCSEPLPRKPPPKTGKTPKKT